VQKIKAKQFAAARQNLQRGGKGAAADLTSTLLNASGSEPSASSATKERSRSSALRGSPFTASR
jgi:hypothetical protein